MLRTLLLAAPLAVAVLGAASGAYPASRGMDPGMGMGTPAMISRKAFEGYYDGHKDTYLNTDVSDKAQARAMHINYAPVLKTVPLRSAPEIYLVEGKTARGQLAVFGSEPGEPTYSPIWKETMLSWKASAEPRSHHERHADRPPRDARRALRAGDLHPAQLPDRQGR